MKQHYYITLSTGDAQEFDADEVRLDRHNNMIAVGVVNLNKKDYENIIVNPRLWNQVIVKETQHED